MKKVVLTLALLCLPLAARAASESENIINQQAQVIQNQKQIDREKELQVELKTVDREQNIKEKEEEEFEKDDLSENDGKVVQNLRSIQCFRPHSITFSKNKLLTAAEEKSLSEQYLHRCFTLDWLPKFDREVAELLATKGYTTSRANSSEQSLIEGKMRVEVIEGMLEKIIINKDSFADKAQLKAIFGFDDLPKGGKVLNIHDLDTALERFNRISSNKISVRIIQGSAANKSIIIIENNPKNTARVNISYDNIGSKSTGERRDTISFAKDNLLHLNDVLSLSRTSNDLDPHKDRRNSEVGSGSWSIPFAQHIFTLSATRNSYFFLTGSSGLVRARGFVFTKSANVESLITKNKDYKISSNVSFASRDNQIFTDDLRNEAQSRKASIASVALSNTFFLDSATLFLKPSYIKSLNILNAKKDGASISSTSPHAEIDIAKFYANYVKKFTLPHFNAQASYNLSFDSQFSKNHLYSVDQFSSGGFYSVRGFRQGNISGDSGFNIRNEISMNLGQMILPKLSENDKSGNIAYLNNFSVAPFYDFGHVQTRGVHNSGRLSSSGFKISFNKNNINSSLTFAHVVSRSRALNQNSREEDTIYFDIGAQMDFL